MKRSNLILTSILLLTALSISALLPSGKAYAGNQSQKEEVVYGLLDINGNVKSLYVVNIFENGNVTDYGNYAELRNLTTSDPIQQDGDMIIINAKTDKLYYQGTLKDKSLPWDISFKYYLNGKELPGDELAGKSGNLKIEASVKQNTRHPDGFYNNYALQISMSLDSKLCSDIKADKATVAEAGSKKQLAWTALPGKGIDFSVTADVKDFKMDPVTISGLKLNMALEIDTEQFTGQITELSDAIKALDEGAGDLLDGLSRLSAGMQEYINGIKAFNDGLNQFAKGASELDTGATELKNGLSELAKQGGPLKDGALAIQNAAFDEVNKKLADQRLNLPPLTPLNYNEILSPVPFLAPVKQQLDETIMFTTGLIGYLDGVSQLSQGAEGLAAGISEFKNSADTIAASSNDIYKAGEDLNTAIKELRNGLAAYKEGTRELSDGTKGISFEIEKKIDDMLSSLTGNDNEVLSFVSEKNTAVTSVQFVLKTDSIKAPEIKEPVRAEPERLTFWQKLLKLFGLYK